MKQRACFVICPIGADGSDIRNDADLLNDFIIKPVLSELPFAMAIRRADKLGEPGIITNQIIHEIESADLVVADLSFGNPNVFYEVAIRHVTRKPFVHLIGRGQRIPFDNAPVRAIDFDLKDLRSVESAKIELASQAKAALEKGVSESPVSMAVTMESLKQSGNTEKIALADILSELNSLRGAVERVSTNFIAAENRFQLPGGMFGNSLAPTNALAAFAAPSTAAAHVAAQLREKVQTENSLAETIATLMSDNASTKNHQ